MRRGVHDPPFGPESEPHAATCTSCVAGTPDFPRGAPDGLNTGIMSLYGGAQVGRTQKTRIEHEARGSSF